MPADTSILMGFRPPQIESQDALNARAAQQMVAQQQNMLGAMQLGEMARANKQKQTIANALSKIPADAPSSEVNKLLRQAYITGGDLKGLMDFDKTAAEAEAAQAKVGESKAKTKQAEASTAKTEFELQKQRLEHGYESIGKSSNPAEYRLNVQDALSKKLITQEQADIGLAQLEQAELQDKTAGGGNANYNKFRLSSLQKLLSARDELARVEPKYEYIDLDGKKVRIQTNPNAPGFNAAENELIKTETLAQKEIKRSNLENEKIKNAQLGIDRSKLGIQRAELKLKQEKEFREKDPAFQQAMSRAKATGEAIAKGDVAAVQALPKILDRADRSINLIDEMVGKQEVRDKNGKIIQAATAPHPGFNSAVGFGLGERFVPGTSASDFQSRFDEIKGGAFLEAFESLKGGGAISEKEGEKGTTALNRMSLAQSEQEFVAAARDFQDVVRKGVANAKTRAAQAGLAPNVDALVDKWLK
jgi:hypothetical protein